jgi:hypothetical protein
MKKLLFLCLIFSAALFQFCTTTKTAAGSNKKVAMLSWQTDIAPVMQVHCSPCHFPDKGGQKKPLNTYEATKDNIDEILLRVRLPHDNIKFMPFMSKKEPLSDSLIQVFQLWKDQMMPT